MRKTVLTIKGSQEKHDSKTRSFSTEIWQESPLVTIPMKRFSLIW